MAPRRRTVSRSTRPMRAPGKPRAQLGLDPLGAEADVLEVRRRRTADRPRGTALREVAVVAARAGARAAPCTVSDTLQCGHSTVAAALAAEHRRRERRAG